MILVLYSCCVFLSLSWFVVILWYSSSILFLLALTLLFFSSSHYVFFLSLPILPVAQITGLAPLHPIVVTLDPLPLLMATLPLLIHVTTFVQEIIGMITTITLVHILPPGEYHFPISKPSSRLHLAADSFHVSIPFSLPHLLVVIRSPKEILSHASSPITHSATG